MTEITKITKQSTVTVSNNTIKQLVREHLVTVGIDVPPNALDSEWYWQIADGFDGVEVQWEEEFQTSGLITDSDEVPTTR